MDNKIFNLMRDAEEKYKVHKSIRKVALCMSFSEQKAKKLLITAGVDIDSPQYMKIKSMLDVGMTAKEVAEKLGVKESYINSFIPYSKGVYIHMDDIDIAKDDNRARIVKSRIKRKNIKC